MAAISSWSAFSGCVPGGTVGNVDLVWGRRGESDGRFLKPRAIAIDPADQLYIVDTTGRIQVFDIDGNFLRQWTMPDTVNGRPTGLTFVADRDNRRLGEPRLLVADTHYYRVMAFDAAGNRLTQYDLGGVSGSQPGQFAFVTDAAVDRNGCVFVGEYGDNDRLQKFSPDGEFVYQFGGTGDRPGRFLRPQAIDIAGDTLWVADACNHRLQSFDVSGDQPRLMSIIGSEGNRPGELYYPYDLLIQPDGNLLICEYGNQRIQCFRPTGELVYTWGTPGHAPGQLYQPWGVVRDSVGRLHVLDSNNHRVQRVDARSSLT